MNDGKFGIYDGTAGANRIVLASDGKLGIGDNSPDRMLHVNSASSNECAIFESTDTEVTLEFKDTTGTASLKCRNDFRLNNSTGELARIDSSGNVGIGTTSPSRKLHLVGSNAMILIEGSGGNGRQYSLASSDDTTGAAVDGGNAGTFAIYDDTANASRLVINSSGNVGIGTTSPTNLLQIHGSAPVFAIRDTASYSAYSNGGKIYFQGTDSDGAVKTFAGVLGVSQSSNNGRLILQTRTGGTLYDRLTIDAAGSVGIGTDSTHTAAKGVHIKTNDSGVTSASVHRDELFIEGNDHTGITIATPNNKSGAIGFDDPDGTGRGRIQYTHSSDLMYIYTSGSPRHEFTEHHKINDGNLVIGTSGHGIDFSDTADSTGSNISMDSELLDDYERGTWGSINTGADSCTFSHNWYVKVGRLVTCNVRLSGITNGNGSALTLNLPFANGTVEASGSVACDTFNMPSDWVLMNSYAYDAKLYILASRDNAGWENLLGNMTANNSTIIMNITYLANS
jgi:hypothetical protein